MIFLLDPKHYPTPKQSVEVVQMQDQNDMKWEVARVQNGFFVRYLDNEYFKVGSFEVSLPEDKIINLKNTNCLFVNSEGFDVYADVRNLITNQFTDDVWDDLQGLLQARFDVDAGLLESEVRV